MSNYLGLSQGQWSDYEKGATIPNGETLLRICRKDKCNASPTWILFGRGPRRLTDLAPVLVGVHDVVDEGIGAIKHGIHIARKGSPPDKTPEDT